MPRPSPLLLAVLVSPLLLPAALRAQGATLHGRGTAVLDGIKDYGEWDDAAILSEEVTIPPELGGGTVSATFAFMNDDDDLYGSVEYLVAGDPGGDDAFVFLFDAYLAGPGACSTVVDEQLVQLSGSGEIYADQFVETELDGGECSLVSGLADAHNGGTEDGAGTVLLDGSVVFEARMPLDTADDAHDLSVTIQRKLVLTGATAGCLFTSGECGTPANVSGIFYLAAADLVSLGDFETGDFSGWTFEDGID